MPADPRANFRFYLITDRKAVRSGDLSGACEAALAAAYRIAPPGTVAVQLREKDLSAREQYDLAIHFRAICTRFGAILLVNDRVDIAIAAGADGVHLPSNSVGIAMARRLIGPNRLIGVSAHSPDDVANASREGADFAVFGPVYDPISKSAYGPASGVDGLAAACRAGSIPVYALGGITPKRAAELMRNLRGDARPAGVAAIGAIIGADSPADAMAEMLAALGAC